MSKLNNDENFKHVSYHATDLRKTFARVRKQQAEEKAAREAAKEETNSKVRALK